MVVEARRRELAARGAQHEGRGRRRPTSMGAYSMDDEDGVSENPSSSSGEGWVGTNGGCWQHERLID